MRFLYEAVMGLRTPDKTGAILADEMGLGERRRGGRRGTAERGACAVVPSLRSFPYVREVAVDLAEANLCSRKTR